MNSLIEQLPDFLLATPFFNVQETPAKGITCAIQNTSERRQGMIYSQPLGAPFRILRQSPEQFGFPGLGSSQQNRIA